MSWAVTIMLYIALRNVEIPGTVSNSHGIKKGCSHLAYLEEEDY